jgi:hypothetical protein
MPEDDSGQEKSRNPFILKAFGINNDALGIDERGFEYL